MLSSNNVDKESFEPLTTELNRVKLCVVAFVQKGMIMNKREPIQPETVYSREEVADLLGVSLSTVKRLISAGQLEASRPDSIRRIFIKGSSVLKMLEETRLGPTR
jgi:excisionase family DNA binding protein